MTRWHYVWRLNIHGQWYTVAGHRYRLVARIHAWWIGGRLEPGGAP